MSRSFPYERVQQAARTYHSNQDAGRALGINPNSFARLCRQYGIETPYARARRRRREARDAR